MKDIRVIEGLEWTVIVDMYRRGEMSIQKGKYLFFSQYKSELIKLAREILIDFDLVSARISNEVKNGNYVLCVNDISPRYKYHLVKYGDRNIYYRYWKANYEQTDNKIYL